MRPRQHPVPHRSILVLEPLERRDVPANPGKPVLPVMPPADQVAIVSPPVFEVQYQASNPSANQAPGTPSVGQGKGNQPATAGTAGYQQVVPFAEDLGLISYSAPSANNKPVNNGNGNAFGQTNGNGQNNGNAFGQDNGNGQNNGNAFGQDNGNGQNNGNAFGQDNGNGQNNGNAFGQDNGNGQNNGNAFGQDNANGQNNGNAYGQVNGNGQNNGNAYGQVNGNGQNNGNAYGQVNGNGQNNGNAYGQDNGNGQNNGNAFGHGNGQNNGNAFGLENGNGQNNGNAFGLENGNGNGLSKNDAKGHGQENRPENNANNAGASNAIGMDQPASLTELGSQAVSQSAASVAVAAQDDLEAATGKLIEWMGDDEGVGAANEDVVGPKAQEQAQLLIESFWFLMIGGSFDPDALGAAGTATVPDSVEAHPVHETWNGVTWVSTEVIEMDRAALSAVSNLLLADGEAFDLAALDRHLADFLQVLAGLRDTVVNSLSGADWLYWVIVLGAVSLAVREYQRRRRHAREDRDWLLLPGLAIP